MAEFNRRQFPLMCLIFVTFLAHAAIAGAAPITPFNFSGIATCVGDFTSCSFPASSSGTAITNSGSVATSGETLSYSASSVSLPGSLGGSVSTNSDTLNSSGPGIMVDAEELMVDSVIISFAPLTGQTGFIVLDYTLHGTNSVSGTDAIPPPTPGPNESYACVHLGINNPIFPSGCTTFTQPSVAGTFSTGTFSFIYGEAFPLWFGLESIAGTGFGSGRATGIGSAEADFYNTATIGGLLLYDQSMNPLNATPTITSSLGISYQDANAVPEPSTLTSLVVAGIACAFAKRFARFLHPSDRAVR
jgi:hypothetical protein